MPESNQFEYDIAISFAGEDRKIAEDIAKSLRQNGISVFYDRFVDLWGKELTKQFESVFLEKAQFCLILVSQKYIDKVWTNYERQIALARQISQQTEGYILPVMLEDNLHLPGLPTVIGYVKFISVEQITSLLIKKIKGNTSKEKQETENRLRSLAGSVIEAEILINDGDWGGEGVPDDLLEPSKIFEDETRKYILKYGHEPPLSSYEEVDDSIKYLIKQIKESLLW